MPFPSSCVAPPPPGTEKGVETRRARCECGAGVHIVLIELKNLLVHQKGLLQLLLLLKHCRLVQHQRLCSRHLLASQGGLLRRRARAARGAFHLERFHSTAAASSEASNRKHAGRTICSSARGLRNAQASQVHGEQRSGSTGTKPSVDSQRLSMRMTRPANAHPQGFRMAAFSCRGYGKGLFTLSPHTTATQSRRAHGPPKMAGVASQPKLSRLDKMRRWQAIRKLPENDRCAECHSRDTSWVVLDYGATPFTAARSVTSRPQRVRRRPPPRRDIDLHRVRGGAPGDGHAHIQGPKPGAGRVH